MKHGLHFNLLLLLILVLVCPAAAVVPLPDASEGWETLDVALFAADRLEVDPTTVGGPVAVAPIAPLLRGFLAEDSLLLLPGQRMFEIGVTAQSSVEHIPHLILKQRTVSSPAGDFTIIETTADSFVTEETRRERLVEVPITWKGGFSKQSEIFFTVPLQYESVESLKSGLKENDEASDIGDMRFGIRYAPHRPEGSRTDWLLSLTGTAPTGGNPYETWRTSGRGHYTVGFGADAVRVYEPAVIFGGFDYVHNIGRSISGVWVHPGQQMGARFGAGFCVRPDVTLSGQLNWRWDGPYRVDTIKRDGTSREPVSFRLGISRVENRFEILDLALNFGLNRDAPAAGLEVSRTIRF